MRDTEKDSRGCGFVLTDAGRAALADGELCRCRPELVGGTLVCRACGTLYAFFNQMRIPRPSYASKPV